MPTHAGQIGFFAGHRQEGETHPQEVALREFAEESGCDPAIVNCMGILKPVFTSRNQAIVPVVGRLNMDAVAFLKMATSNGEWTDLLAIPLETLRRQDDWEWGWRKTASTPQKLLMFPIVPGQYLHHEEKASESFILWGATARMVWEYLALVEA